MSLFDSTNTKGDNSGPQQTDDQKIGLNKDVINDLLDNSTIKKEINVNEIPKLLDNIVAKTETNTNASVDDVNSGLNQTSQNANNDPNVSNESLINDAIKNIDATLEIQDRKEATVTQDEDPGLINHNVTNVKVAENKIIKSLPSYFFETKFSQIDKSQMEWFDCAKLLAKSDDPTIKSYTNSKNNASYYNLVFGKISPTIFFHHLKVKLDHSSYLDAPISKTDSEIKLNKSKGVYYGNYTRPYVISTNKDYRIGSVTAGKVTSDFIDVKGYGGTYSYYVALPDLLYLSRFNDLALKEFLIGKYALPTHMLEELPLQRIIDIIHNGLKNDPSDKDLFKTAEQLVEEIDNQILYYINKYYTKDDSLLHKTVNEQEVGDDENTSDDDSDSMADSDDYYLVFEDTLVVKDIKLDLSKYTEVNFISDIPKKPTNYKFAFNFNVAQFSSNLVSNTTLLDLALQLLSSKPTMVSFRGLQYIIATLDKIIDEIDNNAYTNPTSLFSTKLLELKHIDDKAWLKNSCQNFKIHIENYIFSFCDVSAYTLVSSYSYKDLFTRYYSKYNKLKKYYNIDKVYNIGGKDRSVTITLNGQDIKMNIDIVNNLKKLFLISDDHLEIFNALNTWFFRIKNEVFVDEVVDANMYAYGIICLFA